MQRPRRFKRLLESTSQKIYGKVLKNYHVNYRVDKRYSEDYNYILYSDKIEIKSKIKFKFTKSSLIQLNFQMENAHKVILS